MSDKGTVIKVIDKSGEDTTVRFEDLRVGAGFRHYSEKILLLKILSDQAVSLPNCHEYRFEPCTQVEPVELEVREVGKR